MNADKILVVEDDVEINKLLNEILQLEGYQVTSAFSGTEALLSLKYETYQLILLDLMLPGIDGQTVVDEIRKQYQVPIIIISAKQDVKLKSTLLRLGADDYMTKPFDHEEVLARVATQLRRSKWNEAPKVRLLQYKNLQLDKEAKSVTVNGNRITLTAKEFSILDLLLTHPTKVFSKANLFETIWNESYSYEDNTINVHMSNIRNKIKVYDALEDYIETIWGMGYKLADLAQ